VALDALRAKGTPALPVLAPALERLLQELPAKANGLSRTEHAALAAVAEGARAPAEIFVAVHTREERPFMGDWPFWRVLARLASGTKPMLELASGARPRFPPEVPAAASFGAQRFRLTPSGREVLAEKLDAIALNGIDRWLGGTHLHKGAKLWRWDRAAGKLIEG
jgi:non-ribosomal peptide synthetase component F